MATVADRIAYPWLRVRKFARHASIRLRRTNKRLAVALGPARARAQAVAAQVRERLEALRYRIPGERDSCPACDSSHVRLVDVLPMRRDVDGKRIGFLTGCESCGLLFANPMPSSAELDAFYAPEGHWSASQEEAHGVTPKEAAGDGEPPPKRRPAIIFEALHAHINVLAPSAGSKALDFGCGNGKFLNALQDYKWETYGIEPSTQVAFTRHRELVDPPSEPTFDLVVLNHVLEHVENPLHVLERLARSMRHRAALFISVPNVDALPRHGDLRYCINSGAHVHAFTRDCLTVLVGRAGLEVIATLDDPALDEALTRGKPLRLRLLAKKTGRIVPAPHRPLDAAARALRGYHRNHARGTVTVIDRLAPVRLRAAMADAARKAARERRLWET